MKSSQPVGPHVASTIILIVLCIHQRGGRDSGQWETERPDPWDFANETRLELRGETPSELFPSYSCKLSLAGDKSVSGQFFVRNDSRVERVTFECQFAAIIYPNAIRVLMNCAKEDKEPSKEWYIEYFVLVSLLI